MSIESLLQQNMQNAGLAGIDRLAGNAMFPQSHMDKTQYAVPTQMPTSAEVMRSDYDAPTQPYTGMQPQMMAKGGIATLRYNGEEDGSQVEAPQAWDPTAGQVTLLQPNNEDPSADPKTVGYTIPKDDIKTYVAYDETDPTGNPLGGGQYILKDGSAISVNAKGIVSGAVPGKNDYTLNEQGYYQPTGANLTWNGEANTLTKKIGGVDVVVPNIYHKGGYQDETGKLRTDANGLVVPLAPAYLDSGAGKSGLSDAAPYIALAAMTAATMGAGATGFAGMVPASETLLGASALGAAGGSGFAGLSPELAAEIGLGGSSSGLSGLGASGDVLAGMGFEGAGAAGSSGFAGLSPELAAELGLGGSSSGLSTAGASGDVLANMGIEGSGGLSAKQAMNLYRGANMLNSAFGGGEAQAGYGGTPTAAAPATIPNITRSGVTGYYGAAEAPDYRSAMALQRTPYLSKIRGGYGEMAFAAGGKAETDRIFDHLTEKEKRLIELELMAQSLKPMPGSEYTGSQYAPQGAFGRIGASTGIDENSRLRAGLSGMAMAMPGQQGVKTMPGAMDVGYSTQAGPGNLDLSAFRSINPMPGRGHAQGVNARYTIPFAQGGGIANLGGYSDGGQLLKGPGDGMSDHIPAKIGDAQPARLADGEFVVPADVVSHLGNGSTDAGAKQLYAMMDKVRKARTGNKKQGKQINPSKFLP